MGLQVAQIMYRAAGGNIGFASQTKAEAFANARLIAAAPDLLAALREARETILQLKNSRWSECEGSDAEWVGGLDVVIARATGEA